MIWRAVSLALVLAIVLYAQGRGLLHVGGYVLDEPLELVR